MEEHFTLNQSLCTSRLARGIEQPLLSLQPVHLPIVNPDPLSNLCITHKHF